MDLRWRLVTLLGGLLLALVLVTAGGILYSVKADTEVEVQASERLARMLIIAAEGGYSGQSAEIVREQLRAVLAEGPVRHLTIRLDGTSLAPALARSTGWSDRFLNDEPQINAAQNLHIGDVRLSIVPNRASEVQENFNDAAKLLFILALFSLAAMLVAWFCAHRALSPVRELERGLDRLANGEAKAGLPAFSLQEFQRIAAAIDHLAGALVNSRQAEHQLAQRLIRVQDEERRALARELHDEMGQTLTALGVTATYLERNAAQLPVEQIIQCGGELKRDLKTSRLQLRAMLKQLNPHDLDGIGLPKALRDLVVGWQGRTPDTAFSLTLPAALPAMSEQVALTLYRVAQEALTNVVRHADAGTCQMTLAVDQSGVCLVVCDDGKGVAATMPSGVGLAGMRARLDMVGGRLQLMDNAGGGICLMASVPVARDALIEEVESA
jgi:two-component system, NarL family, sensor histidine kinase UhpB